MRLGCVLYVYKGEWGLPSIDFECLRVLCLVKFTRCPVSIDTNGNPLRSGVGKLPYLQVGNERFTGYRQIKQFLDNEGYPVNMDLTEKVERFSNSYSCWVFNQLHGYYNYHVFGEPNNYDTTRALYAKRTPFPFNFYYPATYQKDASEIILTMCGFDMNEKINKDDIEAMTLRAKQCVNILSRKLGKRVWFCGDVYSELDAIVYSYLALLFRITLPNNPLQNHIKGCTNIVNFINRISRDIFRQEAFNTIKTSKSSPSDPMLTATERHFLESEKKTKLVAGLCAIAAMGTFAAWRGLYKQFSNSRLTYEGYGYDDDEDDDSVPDL